MDQSRYQTIYASRLGAVAAPTAGLHFTARHRDELVSRGHEWVELTLHVGYGTFSPVRQSDIRKHEMHPEYVELDEPAARQISEAMRLGRPVVAIGTTALRALEGIWAMKGDIEPFKDWINIFLYPSKKFHVADMLLTNFHLPGSSLLMLVSAFAGRKVMLDAYAEAARSGYRFFSYGDATLISRAG